MNFKKYTQIKHKFPTQQIWPLFFVVLRHVIVNQEIEAWVKKIEVDYIVVLQVANLLERMECLTVPLHINIHTALKRHHMALCITQARRKEEISNMSTQQQQKDYLTNYRGNSYYNNRNMFLSIAACPNYLLFHRHGLFGDCTEGPRCCYKETPHSTVVCSSGDTS